MSRTWGKADIYIDGSLRWKQAVLTEYPSSGRILVKAKEPVGRAGGYSTVLELTEVEYVGQLDNANRWTGLDGEGTATELTLVPRARPGCQTCGGR